MKSIVRYMVMLASAAVVLTGSGCITPVDTIITDVSSTAWSDTAVLEYENTDTTSLRDITLVVHHDDRIEGDSVTLIMAVYTPDSLYIEEPLRLDIPSNHTPAALMRETDIPYRCKVRFSREGTYHIEITPSRPLKGIGAVGLSITKSE